jgi:hypothetical protein
MIDTLVQAITSLCGGDRVISDPAVLRKYG